MFDVYHQQIAAGDICRTFEALMPIIGHVQIASVPKRGRPDHGDVGCRFILSHIRALGWTRLIGAEYRPNGPTGESIDWLTGFRAL